MGTLYVVATPIGNLEDITLRALRILKEVDLIACEDTRHTGILLKHFEIQKTLISFHQHSQLQKIQFLIAELESGKDIALVTDAGTPGISDPAGVLIEVAIKSKIEIVPVSGVSSLTTLISMTDKPLDRFLFLGFLPKKKGRQTLLKNISKLDFPIVFFESPNRILKTLEELKEVLGDHSVVIGRELTKKFEEIYRGKISEVLLNIRPQGEFVILINR
ncbi:MAG: 16S rRNA (cytidine(1402)-2'-O)-methyltransferase [Patescibacteria group bacterium]|nr:16S rRNA (cytidine(1402)-2'-O)-methyltransferase [Patescibacteria group bacterium]